jgi:mono/diheme cytochrome c family protein
MSGGRQSLASLSVLIGFLACSSDRGSGAAPATSGQAPDTVAVASGDTAAPAPDTMTQRDTTTSAPPPSPPSSRDTAVMKPVAPPVPKAAAPRPAAPKPAPAPTPIRPPADSAAAAVTPSETTAVAAAPVPETSAPLRDQYHQAPRDTVSAEVYDGWKQFNLNCARCHGEDVLGTTIAPHLIESVRPGGPVATKEAFVKTVCEGRAEKGMPAWCPLGLDMEKINAILLYVKGRSTGEIAPGRPARRE